EAGPPPLLRKAALGELGSDLSTIADETLITTGLEAGDAEITVFAQDDFPELDVEIADLRDVEEPPAEEFRIVDAPEPAVDHGPAADIREAETYLGDEPEL